MPLGDIGALSEPYTESVNLNWQALKTNIFSCAQQLSSPSDDANEHSPPPVGSQNKVTIFCNPQKFLLTDLVCTEAGGHPRTGKAMPVQSFEPYFQPECKPLLMKLVSRLQLDSSFVSNYIPNTMFVSWIGFELLDYNLLLFQGAGKGQNWQAQDEQVDIETRSCGIIWIHQSCSHFSVGKIVLIISFA